MDPKRPELGSAMATPFSSGYNFVTVNQRLVQVLILVIQRLPEVHAGISLHRDEEVL